MILAVIVLCVTLTFVIVIANSVKTSAKAETQIADNILYENAYITSTEGGVIRFVCQNSQYEVAGHLQTSTHTSYLLQSQIQLVSMREQSSITIRHSLTAQHTLRDLKTYSTIFSTESVTATTEKTSTQHQTL